VNRSRTLQMNATNSWNFTRAAIRSLYVLPFTYSASCICWYKALHMHNNLYFNFFLNDFIRYLFLIYTEGQTKFWKRKSARVCLPHAKLHSWNSQTVVKACYVFSTLLQHIQTNSGCASHLYLREYLLDTIHRFSFLRTGGNRQAYSFAKDFFLFLYKLHFWTSKTFFAIPHQKFIARSISLPTILFACYKAHFWSWTTFFQFCIKNCLWWATSCFIYFLLVSE